MLVHLRIFLYGQATNMSSGGRCATTNKRKDVASACKKVAFGARRKLDPHNDDHLTHNPNTKKLVDRRASTPIIMVPTPGLRHSQRDTPQSSVVGSSSQPAPPGPTPNDPHDDMDEDSTEAFLTGLLPDLPPRWIMPR
ncbi:hypothetical protein RIF29_20240 [Crotalaria pallida]|uniref:Uncharacterized protein n=1 Tax=Crotalaria pallida TaxID=3830 RepID=A0AAN9I4V0_CROPI